MTDAITSPKPSAVTALTPENQVPVPSASGKVNPPSKSKPVKSRARPRRRVATSDDESDVDKAASDDSLTEHSASEASEDEEDEDAVEDAVDHPSPELEMDKPAFADTSSTTPAAWADETITSQGKAGEMVEMSFEEFNRGGRGRPIRGRGGAVGEGRKKEYTEEQTRKFEEMKARRKEKQKARKAEIKEAKKKERDGVTESQAAPPTSVPAGPTAKPDIAKGKGPKPKGKNKVNGTNSGTFVPSTTATSSAVLIDEKPNLPSDHIHIIPASSTSAPRNRNKPHTSAPPARPPHLPDPAPDAVTASSPPSHDDTMATPMRRPHVDNREAYAQRIANDPKFTPRVGNFWTHDQRHYEPGAIGEGGYAGLRTFSEYWRGPRGARAGFRGGFRGRGRGFPPGPGPLGRRPNGFHGQELSNESENGGPRLEMDKLEAELERVKLEPPSPEAVAKEEEAVEQPPVPFSPPSAKRWGHEGFESERATEKFQANRIPMRGRGRGRGGFPPRGAFSGPSNPQYPVPFPEQSSVTADSQPPPPTVEPMPSAGAEDLATQPAADALLAERNDAVTVKLPGSAAVVDPPPPPSARTPEISANGVAVLYTSPAPPPKEPPAPPVPVALPSSHPIAINSASPVPLVNGQGFAANAHLPPQYPTITGSENGSISSSGHFAPQPPTQYLPPGIGMTQNGDYYKLASGAPVDFRPARPFHPTHPRSFPTQQPQFFPPQSYSPDPYARQQRGSFSSQQPQQPQFFPAQNGHVDVRAGSPFTNPYPQAQLGGYFAPARPTQKVSIRAPGANGADDPQPVARKGASSDVYASIQSQPQGQEYYPQHYNPYAANGMGMQVPMGNSGEVYYDGSGYGYPQVQQYGQGQVPAGYGYQEEYPGY